MSPNKINLSKFTIKLIYLAVPNRALQSQKLQVHIKIKIFMYNLDIFSQEHHTCPGSLNPDRILSIINKKQSFLSFEEYSVGAQRINC